MRILIIGSGGREHALAWKLNKSPSVTAIFVTPGNGGTCFDKVTNQPIAIDDIPGLVRLARELNVDLVVPGPELPLTLGIVDAMQTVGIPCFGPDKYCAQLEGSKAFAKAMMAKGHVPTARGAHFSNHAAACSYVRDHGAPLVIKADGLAGGKGVVLAYTQDEAIEALDNIMRDKVYGDAGSTVIIEDLLIGEEISFLCFCDGENSVALPSSQDHKPIFDDDCGPNTGGMGAYTPAPLLPDAQVQHIMDLVIHPILDVFSSTGHPFKGMLYAGLMMTADGPKVLEYNTRFGDPECQPLLMRLETPLEDIMLACIEGTLHKVPFKYTKESALSVVLAAEGYPGDPEKGMKITGIEDADAMPGVKVFHSGTELRNDGSVVAKGGRVLCVSALGADLEQAQQRAYAALEKIHMERGQFRKDIGSKGLARLKNMRDGNI